MGGNCRITLAIWILKNRLNIFFLSINYYPSLAEGEILSIQNLKTAYDTSLSWQVLIVETCL